MRRLLSLVIALSLSVFPDLAANMPPVVRDMLAQAASECRSVGGVPTQLDRVATEADLNGDNSADWVLDFSNIHCQGAPSYFCGTGGCQFYIFVSQGAEYVRVWDNVVRAWRQTKVHGKPGIQFDLHGSACGLSGAERCVKDFVFDGRELREAK